MRVAALGIDCSDPAATWETLRALPPVDLLVLPELAFVPWLCATREAKHDTWVAATSQQRLDQLAELPAEVVVGTSATVEGTARYNEAFCWTAATGMQPVRTKTFLPDEPGYWEASWYQRGPVEFPSIETPVGLVGISVCTEMWFTQHTYDDVDLVLVPRATPIESGAKWLAGGATHAVCSGAFCISSNRSETVDGTTMGATGWVIDPEGDALATTTPDEPVVIVDIDVEQARQAKQTYPRYVRTD